MNRSLPLLLLVCCFLMISFLGSVWYSWHVLNVYEIPADVRVTSAGIIGINLDADKLHFGTLEKDSSSSMRTLFLLNNRSIPAKVIISAAGELKQLLSFLVENTSFSSAKGISAELLPCSTTRLRVYATSFDASQASNVEVPLDLTLNGSLRVLFRKCFFFERGICAEQERECS